MTALGQTPYRVLSNGEIAAAIQRGERLQEQPLTPPGLYKLLLRCWSASPRQRPSFKSLASDLGSIRLAIMALDDRNAHLGTKGALVFDPPAGYLAVESADRCPVCRSQTRWCTCRSDSIASETRL